MERNVDRINQVYLSVIKRESKNTQLRPLFEGFSKFLERLYSIDKVNYE